MFIAFFYSVIFCPVSRVLLIKYQAHLLSHLPLLVLFTAKDFLHLDFDANGRLAVDGQKWTACWLTGILLSFRHAKEYNGHTKEHV